MYIKAIKLIDFLNLYDFTMLNSNCNTDEDRYDSDVIRIHYDSESNSKWFELGVNNWSKNYYKYEIIKDFLNEKILNMYVYSFKVNWNINTLEVFLQDKEEIWD